MPARPNQLPLLLKLALELGPLVLFFLANAYADRFGAPSERRLFAATGLFIAATLVALGLHYALVRRLPIMPLVSGVVVVVFGGLTLLLNDELFIKLKPTIVNTLFGLAGIESVLPERRGAGTLTGRALRSRGRTSAP
jgi:intracellular septation protein